MKRCPITYEPIMDNENYSKNGLKLFPHNCKNWIH